MEELQTDVLCQYGKNQNGSFETNTEENTATLLNGCEDVEDPLDLMEHCENESIGSNSDVWKGSDSEDDTFENKDSSKKSEKSEDEPKHSEDNKPVEDADKPIEDASKAREDDPLEDKVDKPGKELSDDKSPKEDAPDEKGPEENSIEETKVSDDKPENREAPEPQKDDSTGAIENLETSTELVTVDAEPQTEDTPTEEKDPLDVGETPEIQQPGVDDDCQMDYDAADDDDFDPSLLCPEVSMAVDDQNVEFVNSGAPNGDGGSSPTPFIDEVTGVEIVFNLTPEEQELKRRLYGPTNPIQLARIHCTACNIHLGSSLDTQNNRYVHPMLKVLICKKCYTFYTSGDFEKDEDGSELYCRWCGQGGQVLCCSKCELVFCKRCIRTNFGRKKMFEVRDSDRWDCFRCNPGQLITHRIACFELFEYVRREMPRAADMKGTEIWSKDHSRCCGGKKRAIENGEEVAKKPKKRKSNADPDYNPLADRPDPPQVVVGASTEDANRFQKKDNDIEFVRQIPAPIVTLNAVPRPTYRTILPNFRPVMQPPTLVRISSQPAPSSAMTPRLAQALAPKDNHMSSMMKHEWFEKTVRASARVNSHLSYTLTQLNRAQSQAASVEELAVVHNKLQEILSSSINSLIQIRKNLRTEFITGIKTVRLPSKKPETFNNDDDVIFVSSPPVMPMPSTSRQPTVAPAAKKTMSFVTTQPAKGFLKVKSVKELQNVPSECITIPDDVPSVCNGTDNEKSSEPISTTPKNITIVVEQSEVQENQVKKSPAVGKSEVKTNRVEKSPVVKKQVEGSKVPKAASKTLDKVYSVKNQPTLDIKRMMDVKVHLPKVDLIKLQEQLTNKTH